MTPEETPRQDRWATARQAAAAFRSRWPWRRIRRWTVGLVVAGSVVIWVEAFVRAELGAPETRLPSALYTRPVAWRDDGEPVRPVPIGSLDGAPLEARLVVALDDMPEVLVDAVLAIEDQRFLSHHGLDPRRIAGAFVANVRAGGIAEGGSTITQQLAKNLFLSADRTPLRKAREAAMALVLEARHDKRAILEAYLNEVYLGQDGGRPIHGVGAAARYHLGRSVTELSVADAALLAGMIHAPNRHVPSRHPENARARRDLVLRLMVEQGRLDPDDAARARRAPIPRRVTPLRTLEARHFVDHVRSSGRPQAGSRGVAIYTTLDPGLQRAAERAVRDGLARLGLPRAEAALVALDPRTGDVLAMVGGRDYGRSQFNRAVQARRQPGSAFKPIVALAALERPSRDDAPAYTLASTLEDAPLRVETGRGAAWEPTNYDESFRGEVTLREALEQSLNLPFARIGLQLGPERIASTAQRVGIASPMPRVPSLALGSAEVTPLELARAYGVFATGGVLAEPRLLLGRRSYGGVTVAADAPRTRRVADPAVTWLVTSALQGVVDHGTARRLGEEIDSDGVAGKTGTSNGFRDGWFLAYTPTLVVGLWVGHDDGAPIGRSGGAVAVPIVARFLREIGVEGDDAFAMPEGLEEGYGPGTWLEPCGREEYFLEGTAPTDGGGCLHFEMPDWSGDEAAEQAIEALRRAAGRALKEALRDRLAAIADLR
ncbi:MAG TPA: transglycosylase domain-containing protein [Gemmatimonadales bacterium]|nr:transglycosylase domain-containing protein [Gemmatimonadales bacterium]